MTVFTVSSPALLRRLGLAALGAGVAASLIACASAANASVASSSYLVSYDATSTYRIDDIAIFQSSPGYSSVTNSFTVFPGEYTIHNPFPVTEIPNGDFLIGVATDLATDAASGQQHLVLFSNDSFAANAVGVAFETLFPYSTESGLINDLEVIAQNVPGDTKVAYDDIFSFASGDATGGPNGSVMFATGDTFTEIAFSDGQIVGTGLSAATLVPAAPPVAAAPEPSTWALMLAGVGVVGATLRLGARRTRRAATV